MTNQIFNEILTNFIQTQNLIASMTKKENNKNNTKKENSKNEI